MKETFDGVLDKIEGEIAYLSLRRRSGGEAFIRKEPVCDMPAFLKVGQRFTCWEAQGHGLWFFVPIEFPVEEVTT